MRLYIFQQKKRYIYSTKKMPHTNSIYIYIYIYIYIGLHTHTIIAKIKYYNETI